MLKFIMNTIDDNCKNSILKWVMLSPFFLLVFIFLAVFVVLALLTVGVIFILTGKKDAMDHYNLMIGDIWQDEEEEI